MNLMDTIMQAVTGTTLPPASVNTEQIAINDLSRLVNNRPVEDLFELGDVIVWQQGEGYLYAALKTPIGWTTTAGADNKAQPQIPHTTDFGGLSTLLALDKVTFVAVMSGGIIVKNTSGQDA